MRYEEPIFRPPSEADSLILQATVGCSWNHCTYCAMYRSKRYRVRPLDELVAEIRAAGRSFGQEVTRLFVADGDALAMELGHWEPLLAVGPETGDAVTFHRIAKGAGFTEHALAAKRAHAAGMKLSAIFLLGAGGADRSREHAEGSARLVTEMDPEVLSLLTLTVVPGTPIATLAARGAFELPSVERMLEELRTIVADRKSTRLNSSH